LNGFEASGEAGKHPRQWIFTGILENTSFRDSQAKVRQIHWILHPGVPAAVIFITGSFGKLTKIFKSKPFPKWRLTWYINAFTFMLFYCF